LGAFASRTSLVHLKVSDSRGHAGCAQRFFPGPPRAGLVCVVDQVAVASPLVRTQGIELICSGGAGMKLLVPGDQDGAPAAGHTLECPLCASLAVTMPSSASRSKTLSLRLVFARNIRLVRIHAGISQEVMAAEAGLDRAFVGTLERGQRNIIDNIELICKAIGLPAHELMNRDVPAQHGFDVTVNPRAAHRASLHGGTPGKGTSLARCFLGRAASRLGCRLCQPSFSAVSASNARGASQQAPLRHRESTFIARDDVVQHSYVNQCQRRFEALRESFV
jgi:DNA-binding XRE family transcriptional regulator